MDLLQKYWWVIAIAVVAAMLLASRRSQGASTTQLSSGVDPTALAQLSANEAATQESNRFGFASKLIDFLSFQQNLSASERLANIEAANELKIAEITGANTTASINAGINANNLQYQLQMQALRDANKQNRRNAALQIITSGFQSFSPFLQNLMGGSYSGGGSIYSTPSYNPNSYGGFNWGGLLGGGW